MNGKRRAPNRHDVPRLVVCTAAVLVAHGVAATLVDPRPQLRLPDAPTRPVASVRLVTVAQDERAEVPEPATEAVRPSPELPEAGEGGQAPRPLPASTLAVGSVEASLRFYRFGEVDVAAEPETDWNLQLETLDAAQLERAAFDVWIDDGGRILACTFLEMSPGVSPDARAALEAELMSTVLVPAVRQGVRVASHRRVEIYVDGIKTSLDGR